MESAGNLWSVIPDNFVGVSLLKETVILDKSKKGLGPDFSRRYEHNPAGKITRILCFSKDKEGSAFSYWLVGHRVYETNAGVKTGNAQTPFKSASVLPDLPCVRNDIMDYYCKLERLSRVDITTLEKQGLWKTRLCNDQR
jgi:hypothetical protein